jgi:hypothetical protein
MHWPFELVFLYIESDIANSVNFSTGRQMQTSCAPGFHVRLCTLKVPVLTFSHFRHCIKIHAVSYSIDITITRRVEYRFCMSRDKKKSIVNSGSMTPEDKSTKSDIEAFLKAAKSTAPGSKRGRLVFALDATMSRQPTWDRACSVQADMFDEAGTIGGLDVQLIYFRGFGECRASKWVRDARALRDLMVKIDCRGGQTQISRVLQHARKEAKAKPVSALVYVGDAMEEDIDALCAQAGELGLLGTKAFMFQEGHDPNAERAFREIARLTKGAYLRLDSSAASELGALLRAVAAYATGGVKALEARGKSGVKLLEQLK